MIKAFLGKALAGFQQYLWIALVAALMAASTFGYLYKEALQDIARVEGECQIEALLAANEREATVAARLAVAADERTAELERRLEIMNEAQSNAEERALIAESRLSDFVTEQQGDQSAEYAEWQGAELPSGVVERLQNMLKDE